MQNLIIYKASAGSGKTYKLTEEFIGMALRESFRHILAVTFTNKATAEMKGRITGVLDSLASGLESSYMDVLMRVTGLDEVSLRQKSGELLNEILHNYSRFSVGTIDSFFQRIIRGFARETGLQSGFELELDNRWVLGRVIDRLLTETGSNHDLQNWLMRFAESRIRDGHSWNFRQEIGRLGEQVFSETFLQFRKSMTEKLSDKEFMNSYMSDLLALNEGFEKDMKKMGSSALDLIRLKGLAIPDFSYGSAGVAGYFEKISEKKQYEPGKRVLDAVDDPESWFSGSSAKKEEIAIVVNGGLNKILKDALARYKSGYPEYVTARLILSNFYTLGILNDITRQTREFAEENNLFLLSDVASLLAGIINGNEAPFIYEKTGHFYRHFMIDEFQDTSRIQWKNFIPLITDSLSENKRNIIVGDVKQSIYRWRNGDWRILAGEIEEEMKRYGPRIRPLEINWRSKRTIVEFNNFLFENSPKIMQDQFRIEYLGAGLHEEAGLILQEQIATAYNEHSQKLPDCASREGGYVSVRFIDNEEGDWKAEALDKLPGMLAGIMSGGYRPGDVAILVRNHGDGREIAKRLLEWQAGQIREYPCRLDFISDEFLLLRESVSVQLLVSIIRFISEPGNLINRAHILNQYCRYLGNIPAENSTDHDLFGSLSSDDEKNWENLLPNEFTGSIVYLAGLSLYEMVEQLISIFGLNDFSGEVPYLMAFQDIVLDYSQSEGGGPGPFSVWWEENGGSFSVSSSDRQDAIRIMTIHKAKGLQFKVVVIPFGEWKTDHNALHDNFMWCKADREPFSRLDLVPVKYQSDLVRSIFVHDYFNEKMQVFVDNLNLLYVAFTRSEEELHVCSPLPGEKWKDKNQVRSVSELLYRVLTSYPGQKEKKSAKLTGEWNEELKTFSAGKRVKRTETVKSIPSDGYLLDRYRVNNFREKLKLRLSGNFYLNDDTNTGKIIAHGKLMHEIFENIIIEGDVARAVKKKCLEGLIGYDEADILVGEIKKIIADKRVSQWYDGSWRVRNETGILLKTGKTRRPDRVMIKGGEVVVVDYKFGDQAHPGYAGQVRRYMKELKNMGYDIVRGYVWYVILGKIDEVDLNG
jgi:ATP-dependent helicase/nuclease subunit A